MLRESFNGSDYTPWIRERFDAIALSTRGAREVVFNEQITATEKELVDVLGVTQTPALVFLDAQNKVVMRTAGYRTPRDLKRILDYVDSKSYLTMDLPTYIARVSAGPHYTLRPHPQFAALRDLRSVTGPLMVIFEDAWCDGCDLMHDTLLAHPVARELMASLTVVRLDAGPADEPVVTPDGTHTSARAWAADLGLDARPAILLMDGQRELVRIAGVLRRWHFQTALRYVVEQHHRQYPTLREYSRAHREAAIERGEVVDVGVQ